MSEIILLSDGSTCLVDPIDYAGLSKYRWHNARGYAYREIWANGRRRTVRMHREIMGSPVGKLIDHVNGNKLDNRRTNLRYCTKAQNAFNAKLHTDSHTGVKGVRQLRNKWQARISVRGKTHYLGSYRTINEAAEAYLAKARELQGEFLWQG